MKRYLMSAVVGMAAGLLFLAGSSCVSKKSVVEGVDGGTTVGVMEVGQPTIQAVPEPVNPQITDAVTQTPTPAPTESK